MLRDHLNNLRFDRRLLRRRAWVEPTDLAQELKRLPDVSAKIQPPEEETAQGEGTTRSLPPRKP